jgi:hypothetical protein
MDRNSVVGERRNGRMDKREGDEKRNGRPREGERWISGRRERSEEDKREEREGERREERKKRKRKRQRERHREQTPRP